MSFHLSNSLSSKNARMTVALSVAFILSVFLLQFAKLTQSAKNVFTFKVYFFFIFPHLYDKFDSFKLHYSAVKLAERTNCGFPIVRKPDEETTLCLMAIACAKMQGMLWYSSSKCLQSLLICSGPHNTKNLVKVRVSRVIFLFVGHQNSQRG